MGKYDILIWPTVCIWGGIIIMNYLYRWPLYSEGIEIILKLQSSSPSILDWIFLFITMVIDPTIVVLICILILILSHKKEKGFVMIVFIIFNTYLSAVLKAYDTDPRPFWTDKNVKSIGMYCPVQYGNPSGHSWFSAIFGFVVLMDYWGVGKHYFNIFISIALIILMPLSRMYLGAHSLNQVLQGLALGLCMCLLYVLKIKQMIKVFLRTFNTNTMWKWVLIAAHIIYIIPFVAHRKQELPMEWKQNIIEKCNLHLNQAKLNSLMFIVNAALVNIVTGIGLGYSSIGKTSIGQHYLSGRWQINQQKYELSRGYIVFFVVQAICLLCGLCAGAILFLIFPNIIVAYICVSAGGLISGYIYTTKTCQLLDKYKIIRQTQPTMSTIK